mgnify:CR=1 FL=1
MAEMVASWSEDRSRKVGAVIVGSGNETVSVGFNGLPRRVDATIESRHAKTNNEKYFWFEHAERNAIYNAVRTGVRLEGTTMYCSSFPCADCSRAIIQAGIKKLCTFRYDASDPFFHRHFLVAEEMMREAQIEVILFERQDKKISEIRSRYLDTIDPESGLVR